MAKITFKTDPENTDYTREHGATRNFLVKKLLEEEEKLLQKEREDEELSNLMNVLENCAKDSKLEMEVLENLQELKDLNQQQAHVDFEAVLLRHCLSQEQWQWRQEEEDECETVGGLAGGGSPSKAFGGLRLRMRLHLTTSGCKIQPHSHL